MEKIPIIFDYEGKTYRGFFNQVSGGASTSLFHLMIDNYYIGQLFFTDSWQFHGTKFNDIGELFGDYITAWFDSKQE